LSGDLLDLLGSKEQEESRARKISGVVTGIVTNNNDPEHLGRVKAHFPWLSDNNETDWMRVATFMAGTDRGSYFVPEVNDEILVACENGDLNRPLVIGSLHSKEDVPPEKNDDGKNDIRKIKTRSGHEVIFNDSNGKESVEIHTKTGHKILLDDTPGSEKIKISDKTENNYVQIDSNQNQILLSSEMNIKLKSTNIEIEASGMLKLNGSMVTIN
jgi:uncharacterized protein involved in type VI secretion and phage assembly